MSKFTSLFLVVLFALFALFANAQEDTTTDTDTNPDPITPTLAKFVQINLDMRIPEGYDVIEWQKIMAKLIPACGDVPIDTKLIKRIAGEREFSIYQTLPESQTLEDFKTACEAAFVKYKTDLRNYGRVKFTEDEGIPAFVEVTLPIECSTTCGATGCPACPLLNVCTEDAQCGEFSKCAVSQKNPQEKWCLSSNATMATTFVAAVCAFIALMF